MEDEIERELDESVRMDRRNEAIGQALITNVDEHEDGERVTLSFDLPDGDETFSQTFVKPRYAAKYDAPSLSVLYDASYQSLSDVRHDLFDVHLDANGEWELDAVVEETSGTRLQSRADAAAANRTGHEARLESIGGLLGVMTALQALLGVGLLFFLLLITVPLTVLLADPIVTIGTAAFVLALGVSGVLGVFELNRRLQEMLFDRGAETPFLPSAHTLSSLTTGDVVRLTGLAGEYRVTDIDEDAREVTLTDIRDGTMAFDVTPATGLLTLSARKWVTTGSETEIDVGYCTDAEASELSLAGRIQDAF